MIFDTHTHAYFPSLREKQEEILANMHLYNIRYATQIGCDIETSLEAVWLARKYEPYFATIWYHPTDGQELQKEMIPEIVEKLEEILAENREYIVAIGEIGLDYYHLTEGFESIQKEVQKELFFSMVDFAKKHNLPVVIHTRNAREETIKYIRESGIKKAIIHCFSEDYSFAQGLMEYSDEIHFSFSGILTYKKSIEIQEAASKIPLKKILIETDAPFLSPQAIRGTINESANTRFILEYIQGLRDESPLEVENTIFENSLRVYGLSKPSL